MDKVEDISENQKEHIAYTKAKLEAIEAQALKTNGRVNKLEGEMDDVQVRQENLGVKVAAGVTVLTMVVSGVINKII